MQSPLVILARTNSLFKKTASCLIADAVSRTWSMLQGYLTDEGIVSLHAQKHRSPVSHIRTGDHAVMDDPARLKRAIGPRIQILVYTFEPEAFRNMNPDTSSHEDNDLYERYEYPRR